ncbi:glycosyltransferase family A protein [Levilactobacillus yiduensis]|uniref:glycosyltransferase family A protein n=1 Tax=Levilactobacillus yiduensis TaxID=2953880 RepID=UPI000EF32962|nr:glycosyltransferase family 2 protein [Levilactobacillus yiduensis]AYM02790.1 glycosyltransferase family 2 protein [Levilactobacillus brevis]
MYDLNVIVTVRNSSNTLNKCLSSISAQTYKNFKVIIVDDGSTDGSLEICNAWIKRDHRFVLVKNTTNHHGASVAKNIGLVNASGMYLTFVDSDDWIEPVHFDFLLKNMTAGSLCVTGWTRSEQKSICLGGVVKLSRDECFIKALGMGTFGGYLCNKVFDLNLIRQYDLSLDEEIKISEDLLFVIQYLKHCNGGFVLKKCESYHYIVRKGSLTHLVEMSEAQLWSQVNASIKISSLLDDESKRVKQMVKVHSAKVLNDTYVDAFRINYMNGKCLKDLRRRLIHVFLLYVFSKEFTLHSKISILLTVMTPRLAGHIRRYRMAQNNHLD